MAAGGGGLSHVPNSAATLPKVMQGFADNEASSETTAFITAIAKLYVYTVGRNRAGKWKVSIRNTLLCFAVGMRPGHREPMGD